MRLYLLRHTRPLVSPGICYGQSDIAVNQGDCFALAASMRLYLPPDIAVFSSPLQRCALLASHLHGRPRMDERLAEINFGAWEMRSWDDIPRPAIDEWALSPATYRPGGGESAVDVAQRVIAWLDDLRSLAMQEAVIVTHAGIMRMLAAWQEEMTAVELAQAVCLQNLSFGFAEMHEILVFEK